MDIFDEKIALEKVDGNHELMRELFAMMISELPNSIAELENALQGSDKETKWNIAHKLTGSTAYCGVPALQASSRALEQSIKNELDDIASRFIEVRRDVENVIRFHQENFA